MVDSIRALGTNDTVYMAIPGAASGTRLHVAVWSGPSAPANVDLYARCGAYPTPSTYLARSNNAGNNEFLSVLPHQCGSGSTLYLAVNSTSGAGGFNLLASRAREAGRLTLTGAVEGANALELAVVVNTLQVAAQTIYAASDGQLVIPLILLVNVPNGTIADTYESCRAACQPQFGGTPCNICFIREPNPGQTTCEAPPPMACTIGAIRIGRAANGSAGSWLEPLVVQHEIGHLYFGYPDEYSAAGVYNCGHSVMANSYRMQNFCTSQNHNLDRTPGQPAEPQLSYWTEGAAMLLADPGTPDWYDFAGHPYVGPTVIVTFP